MKKNKNIEIRNALPSDHRNIISVLPNWWNGRDLTASVPKLFLKHFSNTSFIAEKDSQLCGFLIGFFSQTYSNEGYIHFVGVDPDIRKIGLAKILYNSFYDICQLNSRIIIRSCTSPVNKLSIDFHQKMGFSIESGNSTVEGIPITKDYNRKGDHKVLFRKELQPR